MSELDKIRKLIDMDATGAIDTLKEVNVDDSVLPQPKNYEDQLRKLIREEKLSGMPNVDARVADTAKRSRMALPLEKEQLLKAARQEGGSRMITPLEKSSLEARKKALLRMGSKAGKEIGEEAGKGLLKGGFKRAAGLALGPIGLLASEAADASELGPEKNSRDSLLEAPIDAETKQMLLRKQDVRDKVNSPDYLREMLLDSGKVDDMVDSMDSRSDEQREKDAEALLRKKQILSGMRLK